LTVEGGVKKMKIARIICWPRDSTLRPTIERGFDIIPARRSELISVVRLLVCRKNHANWRTLLKV